MSILDMVENVVDESLIIENHPCATLDSFEDKTYYLNALALIMNVDDDINTNETEFLTLILRACEMEGQYDNILHFAKQPDQEAVAATMNFLKDLPIKTQLIFDAIVMSKIDNVEKDSERKLLELFGAKLDVFKKNITRLSDRIDSILKVANNDELTVRQTIKRLYHPLILKQLLEDDRAWVSPKSSMKMLYVEGGAFLMGAPKS